MNASGIIQSIIFPPQEKVIFGPGCVNQLADEVDGLLKKRALVITGPTIAKKTDLLRRVQQILGPRLVGVFFPISQHVPRSNVVAATSRARETKADILISLGGSSPVDGTKAVALCLGEGIVSRDQFDGYRKGDPHQKPIQGQAIPHIAITTTLSAGEFTCGFDITDERHQVKEIYRAPQFIPRIVMLDPEMTVSTPPWLWASTGMRAVDHAIARFSLALNSLRPGHTPGVQAVSFSTNQGKVIISGFCSIKENFEPPEKVREMWPVLTPDTHTNAMDAFDSAFKIKGLADFLIPHHDASFIRVKTIP